MNKRLKIICILFTLVYLFIIGQSIISELVPGFMSGFKMEHNNRDAKIHSDLLFNYLQPKDGLLTLPTPIKNLKTGKLMNTEVRELLIRVTHEEALPSGLIVLKACQGLLSFILIGIFIYIPIQAFRIIQSIVKDEIFDIKNVTRIRRIGYSLLIIFAISISFILVSYIIAQNLVELENYKIITGIGTEKISSLIFGLIVLAFAEILKISHTMKEEQDLTV